MMGAWAFVASPPRAVAVIVWIALVPFAALMLRQSAAVAILVPYVPAAIFALGSGRLRQVPRLLALLVPFAAVAAAYLSAAAAVKPLPIFALGGERISLVTEVAFIARLLLAPMPALAGALALAVLMPLAFFWRWRPAAAAAVIVVVFMSIATVRINPAYADDVTYWKTLDSLVPGHPLLRFNVATALVAGARWEEARDELFYLHYEMPLTPPAGRVHWWYPERYEADRILVQATVLSKLGLVYRALGDDKVAGFYAFPKFLGWNSRVRKHRLVEIGDFCLAAGYVSWAENHYASCLIMDPYDVRLYNACGKCLMYKNFFRAAAKHFRHVLTLDADNETALYHLAFIAKHLNDPDGFAEYSRRWRIVAGVPEGEMDFQPILAAYRFDRDRMRMWFTADPVELLKFATDKTGQDEYYSVKWRGRAWEFSEVPLEAARYFIRRGQDENAYTYLKAALDANPRSQAALPLMVETCRKLGCADEAASYESTAAQEAQK
jgi:tetratricopeptide (TPR) repeat protein